MGSSILVTGANGFIGSYLTRALRRQGWTVFEGVNRQAKKEFEWHIELRNRKTIVQVLNETRPSAIIHLAAISFAAHENREDVYQTNLIGSLNLMLAIEECALELDNFIGVSTASVYGDVEIPIVDENVVPHPVDDYGISKLAMEQMIRLSRERYPITLLRLFNSTGVGQDQKFVVPKIVNHFKKRAPKISLGNLHTIREYNDVRFTAKSIASIAALPLEHNILNVCSGVGYSLQEIMDELAAITGHSLDVGTDDRFVRKNEIKKLVGNPSKLIERIGETEPIPLNETLRWMVESAQE